MLHPGACLSLQALTTGSYVAVQLIDAPALLQAIARAPLPADSCSCQCIWLR